MPSAPRSYWVPSQRSTVPRTPTATMLAGVRPTIAFASAPTATACCPPAICTATDRARSYYAGPDAIVCFLEGTLTPVERTLGTINEHQRLRKMRMLFQHTAEDTFRTAVEGITGRDVIAFSSGIDTKADVATEVFVLEPRP